MGDADEYRHLADAGLGAVSAIVGSIPVGYTLGEARLVSGIKYRLVYNAGNSQINPGQVASSQPGSVGPFSVTLTTTSETNAHLGAVINVNATATTGTYYWGAVRGRMSVFGGASSIPTGRAGYISADGVINLMPLSVITGVVPVCVNLGASASKTVTTGANSGDCLVFLSD